MEFVIRLRVRFYFSAVLRALSAAFCAVVLLATGCAGSPDRPTGRIYDPLRRELSPPWDTVLRETGVILVLIEDYFAELSASGPDGIERYLSPDFPRRRVWLAAKEELFRRAAPMEAQVEGIELDIIFDCFNSEPTAAPGPPVSAPARSYLLAISIGSQSLVVRLPGLHARSAASPARPGLLRGEFDRFPSGPRRFVPAGELDEAVPVTVRLDRSLSAPRARVTVDISLAAALDQNDHPGLFAYRLRESRVFVLRKEGEDWRIISRED